MGLDVSYVSSFIAEPDLFYNYFLHTKRALLSSPLKLIDTHMVSGVNRVSGSRREFRGKGLRDTASGENGWHFLPGHPSALIRSAYIGDPITRMKAGLQSGRGRRGRGRKKGRGG